MTFRVSTLLCLLAGACGSTEDTSVVLLGDASRLQAASLLGELSADVIVPQSSHVLDVADVAREADYALIVNDATQGPTPIVREHILLARQLQVPTIALLLSKTRELLSAMPDDAMELFELEELELRELMNQYELPGDKATLFYDSDDVDSMAGPDALVQSLRNPLLPRRPETKPPASAGTVAETEIYLLSELEAIEVRPIASGDSVSLWVDGQRLSGTSQLERTISPGDATQLTIRLSSRTTVATGSRFIIERNGTIVGIGVIVSVGD